MAIIVNYLWHYIANHLFGNKEALLAKLSLVCITSFKSLLRQEWRSLMSTLTSHILAGRPVNIKNDSFSKVNLPTSSQAPGKK
ncbi:hypothetical protein SAMD00019534_122730 [Acytostelium subglobosum LB1]|uniref:hypothetical protein n=1 Tax=Acytostelium subglobosum LB1 TaxID=1410327 RepID=UPI0006450963|nr:hypothetical protein SAMD00019534_122730 [Acytostelium subglobosum LB1]GAM29097.1 hypothetical protein SAMD00019534_122730 [Acytostelium subglobosum LB1]|eukprot:XP_012747942.1 hypothetical protein SAMD00019534_122730 [Acytostelium subglobosum LB1]